MTAMLEHTVHSGSHTKAFGSRDHSREVPIECLCAVGSVDRNAERVCSLRHAGNNMRGAGYGLDGGVVTRSKRRKSYADVRMA